MPVISALTPDVRRPGRVAVVVDGTVVATLSLDAVERLGLCVGRSWDDIATAAQSEAAELKTYDRAANMLAARSRSVAELRRLLLGKGESAPHVESAIARLLAQGYLDDASFARQFARSKTLVQGLARRRLQQELSRRGVARGVADQAIADVLEDEAVDADRLIDDVARKKLRSLAGLEPAVRRRRLYAHLARRGYDPDAIRGAMSRVLDRAGADADDAGDVEEVDSA